MLDFQYATKLRSGYTAANQSNWPTAHLICEELLATKRKDPKLYSLMALVAIGRQEDERAIKYLNKCISLEPNNVNHYLNLGSRYSLLGRHSQTLKLYERARRRFPGNDEILGALADAHERAGEYYKARQCIKHIIATGNENPIIADAWARLALRENKFDEAIQILNRHVKSPNISSNIFFTLGQAYELAGEIEQSFHSYHEANRRKNLSLDVAAYVSEFKKEVQFFSRELYSRLPKPAHDTSVPIFIAGRPRSGTTLIEKILDSHPDVTGVGELPHIYVLKENLAAEIGSLSLYPDCVQDVDQSDVNRLSQSYLSKLCELAPNAKRFVDKNMSNWYLLGVVALLAPQAHVLHVKRNPIDNCWSCFASNLEYGWASDLRLLGITHCLYERLMKHWHEVLDLPILDVDYEAVVEDQLGWTRRILEFCGLPWDDRCLRYYEESAQKKDTVAGLTLSYEQVRKPIYKTSVGRAKKFEPFLDELFKGFEEGKRLADSVLTRPSEA